MTEPNCDLAYDSIRLNSTESEETSQEFLSVVDFGKFQNFLQMVEFSYNKFYQAP